MEQDQSKPEVFVDNLEMYTQVTGLSGMLNLAAAAKVFIGQPTQENVFVLTQLLHTTRNKYQVEAVVFSFLRENKRHIETQEDVDAGWVLFKIVQDNLRLRLLNALEVEHEREIDRSFEEKPGMRFMRERQEQRQAINKIANEQKAAHAPHEMGTVAEIAAKYGISKAEVRRRKQDGTLNELLN